jgi:hypothetical protein
MEDRRQKATTTTTQSISRHLDEMHDDARDDEKDVQLLLILQYSLQLF